MFPSSRSESHIEAVVVQVVGEPDTMLEQPTGGQVTTADLRLQAPLLAGR